MGEYETTTRRGRVVYNRRLHYFKARDLYRIWRGVRDNFLIEFMNDPQQMFHLHVLYKELTEYLFPDLVKLRENMLPEARNEVQRTIENLSIEMLEEIIEKIPFIPQRTERVIAEWLYYTMRDIINSIFFPSTRR